MKTIKINLDNFGNTFEPGLRFIYKGKAYRVIDYVMEYYDRGYYTKHLVVLDIVKGAYIVFTYGQLREKQITIL